MIYIMQSNTWKFVTLLVMEQSYTPANLEKIQKNYDLKNVAEWLRTNTISLNVSKKELVFFKTRGRMINKNMNFRIIR